MSFTLAIIGRPNVGKSTLFNRLVGKKLAIVHDQPGVTRDWREADAHLMGLSFKVLDTAGLEENFDTSIEGRMRQQTERALARADMAVLVIDARTGLTPMDRHFADWLRRQKMPTALLANKCEGKGADAGLYEAYELGLGEPIPISAEHGLGMEALYSLLLPHVDEADNNSAAEQDDADEVEKLLQVYQEGAGTGFGDEDIAPEDNKNPIKIAIAGRPNVGKSTLLNALVGEERSMTGPEAGITRDAVTVDWAFQDRPLRLVDTAGLRRKSKIYDAIEKLSVEDSLRAVRLAQVVVLVIDATMPFEKQDLVLASHVVEEGRALVIALNKWDAVTNKEELLDDLKYKLERSLSQVRDVPMVTISALNKRRLPKLIEAVLTCYDVWNSRISTGKLNRWLQMMEGQNPPPMQQGRANRLRYMTQIKSRPPTFAIWVSKPDELPDSYQRYLVNGLRRDFDIPGVPIRLVVRTSKNPYKN